MTPRRKSVCGRRADAGIGSCWWWWESCPTKVVGCDLRRQKALAAANMSFGFAMVALVKEALEL